MEVRKGYQKSEFGEIPIDWKFTQIEDEIDLLTGFPFPSNGYRN